MNSQELIARVAYYKPDGTIKTLDEITPEDWRVLTPLRRTAFWTYWIRRGIMSFCCINCHFPTAYGQGSCDACKGEKI